jgi:hypothetical protein
VRDDSLVNVGRCGKKPTLGAIDVNSRLEDQLKPDVDVEQGRGGVEPRLMSMLSGKEAVLSRSLES